MLGDDGKLKLKGGEAWTFLRYTMDELRTNFDVEFKDQYLEACNSLIALINTFRKSRWKVSHADEQKCYDLYTSFLNATSSCDDLFSP